MTSKQRLLSPLLVVVLLFTLAYMAAAAVAAVATGNGEFVFYIVVMVVLIAVVAAVHVNVRLSDWTLAALSLWGLAHMAGGLVRVPESWPINGDIRVLYSWWLIPERLKYDQVVHAYGFGVTTWVVWQTLRASMARGVGVPASEVRPSGGLLIVCAAAGMGFGALNEVVEFAAMLMMPKTNVGGYVNTGWDLVSNAVGCATAAVIIWLGSRRQAFAPEPT